MLRVFWTVRNWRTIAAETIMIDMMIYLSGFFLFIVPTIIGAMMIYNGVLYLLEKAAVINAVTRLHYANLLMVGG